MLDIVFPNNNEDEFIKMAKRLGIGELLFVYEKGRSPSSNADNVGFLVQPKDISQFKKKGIILCTASRDAIERSANIVFGFESMIDKGDKTHYRESGLNHILCTLAKEKNVKIGFSFAQVLENKNSVFIGRMMQNILLCQKFKTPMKIASFAKSPYQMRSPSDISSFFHVLGMSEVQAREALR